MPKEKVSSIFCLWWWHSFHIVAKRIYNFFSASFSGCFTSILFHLQLFKSNRRRSTTIWCLKNKTTRRILQHPPSLRCGQQTVEENLYPRGLQADLSGERYLWLLGWNRTWHSPLLLISPRQPLWFVPVLVLECTSPCWIWSLETRPKESSIATLTRSSS